MISETTNIITGDTTPLRTAGGWFEPDFISVIKIFGAEATRFLQAQTTNDVNQLSQGDGQLACLLDRKARPQAVFNLFKNENDYTILCHSSQTADLLSHLDKFRFADKVDWLDVSDQVRTVLVSGPEAKGLLKGCLGHMPNNDVYQRATSALEIDGTLINLFRISETGEEDFLLVIDKNEFAKLESKVKHSANSLQIKRLSTECLSVARIEAGIVQAGVDYSQESLLAETPLVDSAVSYTKGCFQGQEVLARVRNQGAPTRALVGMVLVSKTNKSFAIDTPILLNGAEIGQIKSNCQSLFLDKFIAIAMVKREFRVPDRTLTVSIGGETCQATVQLLPFYTAPSPEALAKPIYDAALQAFAKEDDLNDTDKSESVRLLKKSLALNPSFEDAYETLGVILSKQGRLDEAISVMEELVLLNPDSIMAHTNLSVFYREKGWKEKAEEEMAESMSIRMREAMRQQTQAAEDRAKKESDEQETRRRMEMFSQVLDIDAEDFLANYGMGDCLVALGEFEKAIEFLEKAIRIKNNHTVSYLALGRAFAGAGQHARAIETWERGIEVAAQRGDLEPLKEMQARMSKIPK